jgi:hypothetical protein
MSSGKAAYNSEYEGVSASGYGHGTKMISDYVAFFLLTGILAFAAYGPMVAYGL